MVKRAMLIGISVITIFLLSGCVSNSSAIINDDFNDFHIPSFNPYW